MARKTVAQLDAEVEELRETVRRLVANAEVVAVAVRTPEAVSRPDLDAAIAGIHAVYEELLP
ncbi:MAG TPA: hypothetical protein VGG88_14005 [Gaiellaceae bacterium]|jgi:hypothetical protein